MNLNILLLGFKRKMTKSGTRIDNDEINRILFLREQLISTGYQPGEINYMIKNLSNGQNVHNLDTNMLKIVENSLEEQLSIAKQCIELTKENCRVKGIDLSRN